MTEYYIPTGPGESEYVEKRSRFLGLVRPVESEEEARAVLEEVRRRHHDARHNCWCYLLRSGVVRYSDDGEPQGTAGQPMLGVFQKAGVTDVVCVVTRYFGGILLGAGGLCRAYTRAAKEAMEDAGISVVRRWAEVSFSCGYGHLGRLTQEIPAWNGVITGTEYAADVTITALLPEGSEERLIRRVLDLTAGTVQAVVTGEALRAVPLPVGEEG